MTRYTTPRLRLRDVLTHNKLHADFMAQAAGVEPKALITPLPKIRKRSAVPKTTEPRERVNLADILLLLRTHPKVACAWRMQSGLFREGERFIKVGVVGIPDIIGLLHGGRFFGIEVKAKGGIVSPMQHKRLEQIRSGGGIAFVAWSVADVVAELEKL